MFSVKAFQANFFDRRAVLGATDAASRRNLSRFGAFARTAARSRIRYRDAISAPGSSPSAHRTMTRPQARRGPGKTQGVSPLREYLFFAFDTHTRSVVIGPARLAGKLGNAPEALEYGTTSTVRDGESTRTVRIRARPYMAPAFEQAKHELPSIWANSVRR